MKRLLPFLFLLPIFFVVFAASSKPDLVVTDMSLEPRKPVVGQQVTITATLRNIGASDANGRFHVRFLADGTQIDSPSVPFGLDAGDAELVSVNWTAELGAHTIEVEADEPFDRIDESNEVNNSLSATLIVPAGPTFAAQLADLKVVVARFEDRSGSGFINVGEGVADELVMRLVNSGVSVLERTELETIMQERGLNPIYAADLADAGHLLGADLIIAGSVTKVHVEEASFSLGFFGISSASVAVGVSARIVSVGTSEILTAVTGEGTEEGATGFSVDIGRILSLAQPPPSGICTGGLMTDKPTYFLGENVRVGYRNPGPGGWYTVHIFTSGGGWMKALGSQYIPTNACGQWLWDQRNAMFMQVGTGLFTAKLLENSSASYIDSLSFGIGPGGGLILPLVDEITVGNDQFDETIVGQATNDAINEIANRLIEGLQQVAPTVHADRAATAEAALPPRTVDAQIARILDDGRIAINAGASGGVSKGDFFQVLETSDLIVDPSTGDVLAYNVQDTKGEIVITEVQNQVSYGVKTSDFPALVGDIVHLSTR